MNLLPKHDILRRLAELIELKHRNVSASHCSPPGPVCCLSMTLSVAACRWAVRSCSTTKTGTARSTATSSAKC